MARSLQIMFIVLLRRHNLWIESTLEVVFLERCMTFLDTDTFVSLLYIEMVEVVKMQPQFIMFAEDLATPGTRALSQYKDYLSSYGDFPL